jgi:hypothetical protein
MPSVFNKNRHSVPTEAIYIGRPSKWGNPFVIGQDGTRLEVIRRYKQWVMQNPKMLDAIRKELRGKDLVCFCSPKACHGDVLLQLANETSIFDNCK